MTLKDIEKIPKTMLVCGDVAIFLHIDAQDLRRQIRDDKMTGIDHLGFPTIVTGCHIKIPKIPFVKIMRGET